MNETASFKSSFGGVVQFLVQSLVLLKSTLSRIKQTKLAVLGSTSRAVVNEGHMTPDHILQTCPNFNDLRARTWSTVTTLQTKLYGSPEDLRKTAAFVQENSVDI